MKFKYDQKEDDREVLAYVDGYGSLVFKDESGDSYALGAKSGVLYVCAPFKPGSAVHKFYEGDEITFVLGKGGE